MMAELCKNHSIKIVLLIGDNCSRAFDPEVVTPTENGVSMHFEQYYVGAWFAKSKVMLLAKSHTIVQLSMKQVLQTLNNIPLKSNIA